MNPLDDFMREFERQIEDHVRQMWNVTEEVSDNGQLFTRAILKGHPLEMIHAGDKVFQLNLN